MGLVEQHLPNDKYAGDTRYYFVKEIEYDGIYCGPCRYMVLDACPFFGQLTKDSFNGKFKRHQKCIDAEE